ncbi:hypothetical protein Hanom_Chr04g00293691 [Helianthus anomalus]
MAWRSVRTSSKTDNNVFNDDSSVHKQECNIKVMQRALRIVENTIFSQLFKY